MKFRGMEETMRYGSELRNWVVGVVQRILRQIMKPLVIICAMHYGHEISMANVFTIVMLIDRLDWPLRMLPNFLQNVTETKR
jgi:hypothetical protein